MAHAFVVILNVAVILACPLVCMGQGSASGEAAPPVCSCPRCHPPVEPADDQPIRPSRPASCLCSGATLGKVPTVVEIAGPAEVLEADLVADISAPSATWLYVHSLERQWLTDSGRSLRVEHCALRC